LQRIKINPEWDRRGERPSFVSLNQTPTASGSPFRVTLSETWYKLRC
jgi:hypothetical protein